MMKSHISLVIIYLTVFLIHFSFKAWMTLLHSFFIIPLPLCICCSRDGDTAELIPSHILLCHLTHLVTKTTYIFSPKSIPKYLKRQMQSIKLKPEKSTYSMHKPSCIFFKVFHWNFYVHVLFFPLTLDSMCVKVWESEWGVIYYYCCCCYLVKPQSQNDK